MMYYDVVCHSVCKEEKSRREEIQGTGDAVQKDATEDRGEGTEMGERSKKEIEKNAKERTEGKRCKEKGDHFCSQLV